MKNPKSCLQDVYDTIVIGGGIAGLTSALELSKSGANVIVLEAESYPGGRVRTIRYDGQYAEAGAMVVTEEENTLLSLLKDLSINSLVELGSHGVELFIGSKFVLLSSMDGQIRKISDLRGLFEFFIAALTSRNPKLPFPTPNLFFGFRKAVRSMKTQAEFINYPYRPGARIGWDTQTFGEFLNQFHPGLRPYFDLWMKVTAGELTDHISLFWGLVTFYWNINSTFFFIRGGTSLLPERIATLLKDRLCLNSRVVSVSCGEIPKVTYMHPNGCGEVSGRTVVIATTPNAALEIVKNLEPWKKDALRAVKFSAYIPVHLRCQRRFWEDRIRTGYLNCSGTIFADLVDGTRGQPGKEGILICFIAGREARRLLEASDLQIFDMVCRDLERLFPGATADIIEHQIFRWPEAISFFPPQYQSILEDLRRPQGNIFFCGDYTQGAGINDAFLSGQISAKEVMNFLTTTKK